MSRHLSSVLLLLLAGCAAAPGQPPVALNSPLLDGRELFGAPVAMAEEADILGVSPAMSDFIDKNGRDVTVDWLRMKRLLRGMAEYGYLDLKYDADITLTAAQTFQQRLGNCLSFTNLFVALARETRLDAQYQIIEVPPIWDSADGWVMLNSHINVIVHNVRMGVPDQYGISRDYIVDFNTPEYRGTLPRRPVTDRVAFALFYNNRAVEALRAGDTKTAFANIKLAVSKSATVASVWVNLGALYSRSRHYDSARLAYEAALRIAPDEKSALTNLARLHEELGNTEVAASYRQRIRQHEASNPYYHFGLAQSAYGNGNDVLALDEVRKAIALKRDDHRFYFLEGLIHYRQGDVVDARASIATAQRLSEDDSDRQRYAGKLAVLGAKSG
jgi:Flp pilus assembly protein TadD